ncbi:MAG: type II CAAX prenyl endopeptidase Rce1 family protein, partial [Gemmatimonadaceae bacterium]
AFKWVFGARTLVAGAVAAVVGALVFSAFHYVGEYGEPLQLASFTFRAIAGLVFSGLYLVRGFGITAWTHALYDVYVMVL